MIGRLAATSKHIVAKPPPGPPHAKPKVAAFELATHSFWAGVAVVVITLVAVGLAWFDKGLIYIGWIAKDDPVDWAVHICEYALLTMDVALVIGVVGKLAWKFLKDI
jgi:hypothetical protein